MLKNFDEITYELNSYEQNSLLPKIKKGLLTKLGKKYIISSTDIIKAMKTQG